MRIAVVRRVKQNTSAVIGFYQDVYAAERKALKKIRGDINKK